MTFCFRHGCALLALATLVACAGSREEDLGSEEFGVRVCAAGPTLEGVDVSKWDGTIDWNKVQASSSPKISFAIARVSDGLNYPDATFATNYSEIKRIGLVRGSYQFFRPLQDPIAQADMVLQAVGKLEPGDLAPAIDIEDTPGDALPTPAVFASQIKLWVDHVRAGTGRTPLVYTRASFWDPDVASTAFAASPLWVAHYSTVQPPPASFCPNLPAAWNDWAIWQYHDKGSVPGISSQVDLNYFNGTLQDLQALAGSGDAGTLAVDASEPGADAAPAAGPDAFVESRDAAGEQPDAAEPVDAAEAEVDAHASGRDARPALADVAFEARDAAVNAVDAGVARQDAGAGHSDAAPAADVGTGAIDSGEEAPDASGSPVEAVSGCGCKSVGTSPAAFFLAALVVLTRRRRA